MGLVATLGLGSTPVVAELESTDYAIVVAQDSPLSGLSFHELKMIFKGERARLPGGKWVIPINHDPSTRLRQGFDNTVLGMTPEVTKFFWELRESSGESGPPRAFRSSALIVKVVNRLPAAIGYVPANQVGHAKVLKIDGNLPGEPAYSISF